MVKTFGLVALAAVAALVLGFGSHLGSSSTPKASADTTDIVVIGCEFIAGAIDGNTTDGISDDDVQAACGGRDAEDDLPNLTKNPAGTFGAPPLDPHRNVNLPQDSLGNDGASGSAATNSDNAVQNVAALASAIGDEDGTLEASDFRAELDENWDDNQIGTDCSDDLLFDDNDDPAVGGSFYAGSLLVGFACSLDVFVFVNDEAPVNIDVPSGLTTVEAYNLDHLGSGDFTCDSDVGFETRTVNVGGATVASGADATSGYRDYVAINEDNDCSDGTDATKGVDNNGDGVVLFHVVVDNSGAGDVETVEVTQEAVEQSFDVNVVGPPNDVKMTLVEELIETAESTANMVTCVGDASDTTTPGGLGIPGSEVSDLDSVTSPTSTLAYAIVTDQDDTVLTRIPVYFSITPPEDDGEIAALGAGNVYEEVSGGTFFTLDPETDNAPTAAYIVVCGGKESGTTTVDAEINIISGAVLSSTDHSSQELTVGGTPSAVALTASASQIKCDGTEKATITADVKDSNGDAVADGVPVSFSVVALGTANPINTVTTGGKASSEITPLSNSSAGVTVIVTAGDSDLASPVQTSILVGCTLPLATQPTLAPVPTKPTGITGPDTGNGGYLAQDGSSFPMWTLIVLALGSLTLVAGGAVARRAGK